MSDTKRNALAELAEELASLIPNDKDMRELDQRRWNAVDKASRIVAELAKVKLNGVGWPGRIELADAYENCRAIAEEGAQNV